MNNYETVIIARPDLAQNQVEELIGKFENVISEQKGKVTKKDFWGLKNLAYPIAKNKKGHYVVLEISAPATAIAEFERKLRLDEGVLRYLTIREQELTPTAAAKLKKNQAPAKKDEE